MPELPINLEDLKSAFQDGSYEVPHFLDIETGEIYPQFEDDPFGIFPDEDTATAAEQAAFEQRYLLIPFISSREGYQDMEDFIATVSEPVLREKLEIAIQGSGAFRRFKNVLLDTPERERWFKVSDRCVEQRAMEWLEQEKISIKDR